jgi:site-specific DNA-methyltransferase (adenine-specific)
MWPDVFRVNSKEKDWHPMQQPLEEAEKFVRYFTQPGDLVVDPCSGSFTTAVACKNLGRRFIGCDIRTEYVSKGQTRLAGLSLSDWERMNPENTDQHQENGKE